MGIHDSYREKYPNILEYSHTLWGELIYGTKYQLILLGVGAGIDFPISERKRVRCLDPRGYTTKISLSKDKGEDIYCASITFPGRDRFQDEWISFDQGVELQRHIYWDDYKGDARSLTAAGLVSSEFLPGQPGMGKIQVTLDADGNRRTDTNGWKKREAGAKTIKKISRTLFLVSVAVSEDVAEVRRCDYLNKRDEWEARMQALPRPKSLTALSPDEIMSFRLVISKRDKKFQSIIASLTQSNFNE